MENSSNSHEILLNKVPTEAAKEGLVDGLVFLDLFGCQGDRLARAVITKRVKVRLVKVELGQLGLAHQLQVFKTRRYVLRFRNKRLHKHNRIHRRQKARKQRQQRRIVEEIRRRRLLPSTTGVTTIATVVVFQTVIVFITGAVNNKVEIVVVVVVLVVAGSRVVAVIIARITVVVVVVFLILGVTSTVTPDEIVEFLSNRGLIR